jgi:hypothetical protein
MTDSSVTPITAASNGGTTTDSSLQEASASPARPERGIARLREHEVYYLTSLVQSALYEAEHLVREVHDQAQPRYLDHDHDQPSEPLDADELSRLLSEAYQCTTLASTYIDKAAMGLLDPGAATPF